MKPHIVAGPLRTAKDGQCIWLWHYCGVWLHCEERAIPGDPWLCADHLLEFEQERDRRDRTGERRIFPPTAVELEELRRAEAIRAARLCRGGDNGGTAA